MHIWKNMLSHLAQLCSSKRWAPVATVVVGRHSSDRCSFKKKGSSVLPHLKKSAHQKNSAQLSLLNWKKVLNFLLIWKKVLICLAHLCSAKSTCRNCVQAVSKVEAAWLAWNFVPIYLAHLIRSAQPACSSGKQLRNYLSQLEKSPHLGTGLLIWKNGAHLCCSFEKNCTTHLAHLRKSAHLSLLIRKKVHIFLALLKKNALPPCSVVLI